MKKFTKLFLSCAAVAAVTAAVATSAMAEEKTLTATYNEPAEGATTTTVTIQCASEDEAKTLLILKPGVDRTNITDPQNQILQIDQAGTIATATIPVLNEETDKGTYKVYMGGSPSGDIYVGSFKIGSAGVLIGDADLNEDISLADATAIIQYKLKGKELSEEALLAADANQDEDVSLGDATAVIQYKLKGVDNGYIGKTN